MSRTTWILVVDDNDALRENLTEALELEGYAVQAVADGHAALDALRAEPLPGVVIIDMMMPGLSGAELVARIRAEPRLSRLKVLLATGMAPARDALPVDAVLQKPFGVVELLAAVGRLLEPGLRGASAPAP